MKTFYICFGGNRAVAQAPNKILALSEAKSRIDSRIQPSHVRELKNLEDRIGSSGNQVSLVIVERH
jgi:hypothetical protein